MVDLPEVYKQVKIKIGFPDIVYYLNKLVVGESYVDLGCGPDSPSQYINKRLIGTGVDASKACIDESRGKNIFSHYVVADVKNTGLKGKSFDSSISLDVLNLLKKDDGHKMIKEMERITRKRIIILVPNGKIDEPSEMKKLSMQKYRTTYKYLKWRSSWTTEEMKGLGFNVIGINGIKGLRKNNGRPVIWPSQLGVIVSDITQFYAEKRPELAFHLLCWRDLK
jgi:predicted TPR repeat methyltransferase